MNAYPEFTRFGTVTDATVDVIRKLADKAGWSAITIISGDPSKYRAKAEEMKAAFGAKSLSADYKYAFETEWSQIVSMMQSVYDSSKGKDRVIFFIGSEGFYRQVVCASIVAEMKKGIVWLSEGTWRKQWWKKSDALTKFHIQWLRGDVLGATLKVGV